MNRIFVILLAIILGSNYGVAQLDPTYLSEHEQEIQLDEEAAAIIAEINKAIVDYPKDFPNNAVSIGDCKYIILKDKDNAIKKVCFDCFDGATLLYKINLYLKNKSIPILATIGTTEHRTANQEEWATFPPMSEYRVIHLNGSFLKITKQFDRNGEQQKDKMSRNIDEAWRDATNLYDNFLKDKLK